MLVFMNALWEFDETNKLKKPSKQTNQPTFLKNGLNSWKKNGIWIPSSNLKTFEMGWMILWGDFVTTRIIKLLKFWIFRSVVYNWAKNSLENGLDFDSMDGFFGRRLGELAKRTVQDSNLRPLAI